METKNPTDSKVDWGHYQNVEYDSHSLGETADSVTDNLSPKKCREQGEISPAPTKNLITQITKSISIMAVATAHAPNVVILSFFRSAQTPPH